MDQTSPVQAQRVWQRVRTPRQEDPDPVGSLIRAQREAACTYLMLSRHLSGREGLVLRRMFEQAQAQCSCLRGMYIVQTGKKPELPPAKPLTGSPDQVLRACYGKNMRVLSACEARISDPEYGPVYARLRDQALEHCRLIPELIGCLAKD